MKRLVESQEEANVDCTLSLGTPSTRYRKTVSSEHRWRFGGAYSTPTDSSSSSCSCISISQSAWDILQIQAQQQQQSGRGIDGDFLVPRRCTNCDTTSTPLWRNGPRGPKSLCNACGIRYKKEERRSTVVEPPQHRHHLSPWSRYATPQGRETSSSMSHVLSADQLHLVHGDEDRDDDVGVPFLSWTCNASPEFPWSQVSSMI